MEKEKYLPMLRAIQEVKAQRYVSTEKAYQYLKDRKRWDDLYEQVRDDLRNSGSEIGVEELKASIRHYIHFREAVIVGLIEQQNPSQEIIDACGFVRGSSFIASDELFGTEIDFLRRCYFSSDDAVLEYTLKPGLVDKVRDLVKYALEYKWEEIPDDDRIEDIIFFKVFSMIEALAYFSGRRCELDADHPLFPGDEFADDVLTSIVCGLEQLSHVISHALFLLFDNLCDLFQFDVETSSMREASLFFASVEMYMRVHREQVLHDIWRQRELLTAWVEKYPSNYYTKKHDADRIETFEDSIRLIDGDIVEAENEIFKEEEFIERSEERLENHENKNAPFSVIQQAKDFIENGKNRLGMKQKKLEAFQFIRLQLFRHRRFLEKFLDH